MVLVIRFSALGAVLLLIVLGVSCAGASDTEEPSSGQWGSASVVEELAIGMEFGDDAYMFGAVHSIAVAADGTMYVADRQQELVRMYDGDGTYLRDVGAQGQGPGEYAYAPRLGVLPDGTVAMGDASNSRVSLFTAEGEYIDSIPAVPGAGLVVGTDGSLNVGRFEGAITMVRYSRQGEELGRVDMPPPDRAGDQTFVLGFGEGDIYAFPTETASAWSPLGYLVTGRNDAYDIELRKPDGTVHLRRDIEPAPLAAEEQAQWEAFRRGLAERVAASGRDASFEPIPDTKPYFRRIHVGDDGRIWVFRYVAAEKRDDIEPVPERPDRPLLTWREPWTFDVFEPDGTFLGSVVVPETFRPFVFRGDRIWGALLDEAGVEQVVRLAVIPEDR